LRRYPSRKLPGHTSFDVNGGGISPSASGRRRGAYTTSPLGARTAAGGKQRWIGTAASPSTPWQHSRSRALGSGMAGSIICVHSDRPIGRGMQSSSNVLGGGEYVSDSTRLSASRCSDRGKACVVT
jgi:hypothetical protein